MTYSLIIGLTTTMFDTVSVHVSTLPYYQKRVKQLITILTLLPINGLTCVD